ncbi:MarR family winged helix-turn-helix transcriptional regulator [Corynebacterium sp. 335C]
MRDLTGDAHLDERDPRVAVTGLLTRLAHHQRTVAARMTVGDADMRLLWLLRDGRPRTMRDIADALGREQSTVNRQVNGAVQSGLLGRGEEEGRRAHVFTPTPEGTEVFAENLRISLGANEAALDALGERAGEFLDLFGRFTDAFEAAAEGGEDAPGSGGAGLRAGEGAGDGTADDAD